MLATCIPAQRLDVSAASETYDIEYANGAFTEDGDASSKGINDYFDVKKIVNGTDGEDTDTLVDDCTITTQGSAKKDTSTNDVYIDASKYTKNTSHTSFLMEYNDSITYSDGTSRKIVGYEVTTASVTGTKWMGRPTGIMLPFYHVDTDDLEGYFALVFNGDASKIQYTYGFVGAYREYSVNTVNGNNGAAFTNKTDAQNNTIDYTVKLRIVYVYSDDGKTIDSIKFSVIQCFIDGTTATVIDNASFGIADVITGTNGFLGTAAASQGATGYLTSSNCPTSFLSTGAVAGYISGTSANSKNNYISKIKVSLNKTEEEINGEAAGALPNLYAAFLADKSYDTANAYLEVYMALPDDNKLAYSNQITEVNAYLKSVLVSNGVFNFDKVTLSKYPSILAHVWPTSTVQDTDHTYPSSTFYDNTDVTTATAVFDRSAISTSTQMYMFTDLVNENSDVDQDTTDRFGLVNEFGTTFTNYNTAITFYTDENGTSGTKSLPIINATNTNLGTYSYNVMYKSLSSYATDVWANDAKDNTKSKPLSYDSYVKVTDTTSANYLPYMAVEFDYKATELTENDCTKINFIVRLWADDGNGIYEPDVDVMLAQKDRSDENSSAYMAIAYLNDEPRERNFALTGHAYKALHALVLGSPSAFLVEYAELVETAKAFSIENYMGMSDSAKAELKAQINAFLSGYNNHEAMIQRQTDVATARTNIANMLGAIVLEETGENPSVFETDYAETLALDAERLAPYDVPEVDEMLAVYEVFEEVAANALNTETVAQVTALRQARKAWNVNSDATIAESYQTIWGDRLTTSPNAAWNVYNRLTADQKALLTKEYKALATALKEQTQIADDAINVYCVGDSITNGNGSTTVSTDSYPAQLQTKLTALNPLYSVSKFAVGGSHVYKWAVEEGATENVAFTETAQWAPTHDGNADIVILQLGTNDLDNVIVLGDSGEEQYLTTYESIVQSYLRLENTPYVILSNTPVNYKNVDSTIAQLNMQIASKYGLPCVDMYAYTLAYSTEEITTYYNTDKLHFTTAGYEVIAQVFCDAIDSLKTEFDTEDITGFSFDESKLNSFLTPELHSATIKNETDPSKQGLGFETNIGKYHRTGTNIVAYGTIFARYNTGNDYTNMTLDNVGNGTYFKATIPVADDSGLYETSYIAGINCRENADFKKVYIARSYIEYADGSVYYSMNTRTDKLQTDDAIANAYKNRVGVVDGYATRSLISVSKNMIKALAMQGITDSNVATYDESTDKLTIEPTATENDAQAIFNLICGNKEKLDSVYRTVYLSNNGNDANAGTQDAPYATLSKALASVPNDGTIVVKDTSTVDASFVWKNRSKAVTITGGTLDMTALPASIVVGNDVTFDDITLAFDAKDNLFATGNKLVMGENVVLTNPINVYGGGKAGTTVASTDVTLLSGTYYQVYGGSLQGIVTGDTHLYIGGTVNDVDGASVHGNTYRVYAGGNSDTIGGNTYCTFTGNAQANQLFGGSDGASEVTSIAGVSNVTFESGSIYALIGGNDESENIGGTNVTVNGGSIAQIFGANMNAGMGNATKTADVNLQVLGGTISRRIYGGCYNEYGTSSFDTDYYVYGKINLTLGEAVNITYSVDNDDRSVYARSRHNNVSENEISTIIYENDAAKTKHEGNLKAQDWKMSTIMLGISACDSSYVKSE